MTMTRLCINCRHVVEAVEPLDYFCGRIEIPRNRVTGALDVAAARRCTSERYPGPGAAPLSVCGKEAIYWEPRLGSGYP